jgi:hypothetical protein
MFTPLTVFRTLTPGFWRAFPSDRPFRTLCPAFGYLIGLVLLLELLRLRLFYVEHRSLFESLRMRALAEESASVFPRDLQLHFERIGGELQLVLNRELPFEISLPTWCNNLLLLGFSYLGRLNIREVDELLPKPVLVFTSAAALKKLDFHQMPPLAASDRNLFLFGHQYLRLSFFQPLVARACEKQPFRGGKSPRWVCAKHNITIFASRFKRKATRIEPLLWLSMLALLTVGWAISFGEAMFFQALILPALAAAASLAGVAEQWPPHRALAAGIYAATLPLLNHLVLSYASTSRRYASLDLAGDKVPFATFILTLGMALLGMAYHNAEREVRVAQDAMRAAYAQRVQQADLGAARAAAAASATTATTATTSTTATAATTAATAATTANTSTTGTTAAAATPAAAAATVAPATTATTAHPAAPTMAQPDANPATPGAPASTGAAAATPAVAAAAAAAPSAMRTPRSAACAAGAPPNAMPPNALLLSRVLCSPEEARLEALRARLDPQHVPYAFAHAVDAGAHAAMQAQALCFSELQSDIFAALGHKGTARAHLKAE